jgi:hypothetical protein
MMLWVASNAGRPFELPNLPHLSEKDREVYKKQVLTGYICSDFRMHEILMGHFLQIMCFYYPSPCSDAYNAFLGAFSTGA